MIRSALAALLITAAAPLSAQSVAIVGGTVALGDGSEPIQNANVVIRNGRIVGAGYNFPVPRDAEVIDAANEHGIAMIFAGLRHFKH